MRASPQTPAKGGQGLPQWITPCYNGVGLWNNWWGGLLVRGQAVGFWAGWPDGLLLRSRNVAYYQAWYGQMAVRPAQAFV